MLPSAASKRATVPMLDVLLLGDPQGVEVGLELGDGVGAAGLRTASASFWVSSTKSAALAEKSVSDFSSTSAAVLPSRAMATAPWLFSRSSRVATLVRPFSRRIRAALVGVAVGLGEGLLRRPSSLRRSRRGGP